MGFFDFLFKSSIKPLYNNNDHRPPVIGALYCQSSDGNPFSKEVQVLVKDVQGGYVLYDYTDNSLFTDNSLNIEMFNSTYTKSKLGEK